VIPVLKTVDSRFDTNFARTRDQLQHTEDFLQSHTAHIFANITQQKNNILYVDSNQLLAQHPAMQYRLLVHWLCTEHVPFTPAQSFFNELLRFLQCNKSTEHRLHPTWKLKKHKYLVYILRSK
jgi:hypothetical protein